MFFDILRKRGSKNRRSLWIIHNWFGKKIDFHILSNGIVCVMDSQIYVVLFYCQMIIKLYQIHDCKYIDLLVIFFYHLPLFYFVNSKYIVGSPFFVRFWYRITYLLHIMFYDMIWFSLDCTFAVCTSSIWTWVKNDNEIPFFVFAGFYVFHIFRGIIFKYWQYGSIYQKWPQFKGPTPTSAFKCHTWNAK